jgi:hypothetical protein
MVSACAEVRKRTVVLVVVPLRVVFPARLEPEVSPIANTTFGSSWAMSANWQRKADPELFLD